MHVSNPGTAAWCPQSVCLSRAPCFEVFRLAQSIRIFSLSKWFLISSPPEPPSHQIPTEYKLPRAVGCPVVRTASLLHQDHFLVIIQLSPAPESQNGSCGQLPTFVYMAFPFLQVFQLLLLLWWFPISFNSFCHPSMVWPC